MLNITVIEKRHEFLPPMSERSWPEILEVEYLVNGAR